MRRNIGLVFQDPDAARGVLDALRAEPRITAAAIYGRDGVRIVNAARSHASPCSNAAPVDPLLNDSVMLRRSASASA